MNILLVNTNQISIRFVEELLAKNNIHGEIAMVRAGKFALDLVQGMHVDLLVCEIESETKEKTKHFLSESRKMTPDAYYFVLMDGESLEYMEEEFLNALDDFITIPFEDRALKLRLNRGILACIEKKKKAGIVAGRPSARMAEVTPVNTAPVETGHVQSMTREKPVKIPEPETTPSPSTKEPAPAEDKDIREEKLGASGRRVSREEFQYEPSYEELLQQRNRILRKEKEAAWLQAMSSQISSYALDEEMEKPLRVREERKTDPMVPSSTESIRSIPPASEISTEPEPELPVHSEPVVPEPVKPVQKEAPSRKDPEPASETPKAKSVVKSLFKSLSKLTAKSSPQHLEPLLASANTGVDDTESSFGPDPEPHSEPSSMPSQLPTDSPAAQPVDVKEEPIAEPIAEPEADPSPESSAETPLVPSADLFPDSETQDDMGTDSSPDMEDPLLSDDRIPEQSFLESPIPDEEYVQEIPPLAPERIDQDVTEAVPEEASSIPEEPVDDLHITEVSLEDIPVVEVSEEESHEDEEDRMPETAPDPSDTSAGPLPDAGVPSSGTGQSLDLNENAAEKDAEEPGESQPSPKQVPHLQDEVWLDPTEPFIMEPDESVDDPNAPLMDLIEEVEVFGIEEDVDISLAAEEDPLLEEALVMPFEEDPWRGPETVPDPLQDSGDGESGLNPLEQEDPASSSEKLEERISEPVAPEPVRQDPIPHDSATEETPVPPKKESLDLRQYLKEPQEEDAKGLKSKFRKTFGKKSSS